jgi:hypothetical protein
MTHASEDWLTLHSSAALVKFERPARRRENGEPDASPLAASLVSRRKNNSRGFLVDHGWLARRLIRRVGHATLRQLSSQRGSAKLPETLDVSTIVDSIGDPANQWNWPLKAFGWA